MSIKFKCKNCGKHDRLSDDKRGKKLFNGKPKATAQVGWTMKASCSMKQHQSPQV